MLDVATVILVAPYEMKRVDSELGVVGTVPLRADASALSAVDQLLRIEVSSAGSTRAPEEKGDPGTPPARPKGGRRNTCGRRRGESRGGRGPLCPARESGR